MKNSEIAERNTTIQREVTKDELYGGLGKNI